MKKILILILLFILVFPSFVWALSEGNNRTLNQKSLPFDSPAFKIAVLFGLLIILFLTLYVLKKVWEKEKKKVLH